MSIEEKRVEGVAAALPFTKNPGGVQRKHWYTVLRSPLWLCLLVALLIRIWLTYHTHGVIDGDEAMLGIQAEHILRGEHPIYYYGQPYMGSLEAYFIAVLLTFIQNPIQAIYIEQIALSLLLIVLTWRLATLLSVAVHIQESLRSGFVALATFSAT